ncbi:MAG TPA: AMP-binding protein, partial [Steroidobacteraceae bacterium]|nr:AMP-binding protein [Steroidobacteraceae bacterium]
MSQYSFVNGLSDVPLLYETIGKAFDRAAATYAHCDALIVPHQNIRWSYAQLKERVDELAAAFVALGLEKGDRIGIWTPNRAEWALTQFATAQAGLILVNINPAYRLTELEFALNKVGCKALVTAAQFKTSNYLEMLNTLAPELAASSPGKLQAKRLPHLRTVIRLGSETTPDFL